MLLIHFGVTFQIFWLNRYLWLLAALRARHASGTPRICRQTSVSTIYIVSYVATYPSSQLQTSNTKPLLYSSVLSTSILRSSIAQQNKQYTTV